MAPPAVPRSVHGQPPGKQPYPDDRTPEAEAARAQQAGDGAAAGAAGEAPAAAAAAAGPRGVHGQPPGKQPHPDDPAFAPAGPQAPGQGPAAQQPEAGQPASGGAPGGPGPRSVHGEPPGKQPHQLYLIAAGAQVDEEPPRSHRHPQHQHLGGPAAAEQGWAGGGPTGSSGGAPRQRSAPPPGGDAGSRKRPASQLGGGGDGGQRKRPANGAAGAEPPGGAELQRLPTGMSAVRTYSAGVPASLARGSSGLGGDAPTPLARPMPGAPRSLQQRQQLLMNGGSGPGAPRQVAGAPRARTPAGASKPKPPPAAKAPSSGQRRAGGGAAGGGGTAAAQAATGAHRFQYGDVVWAKIGVYPWWPAQLQRPTAEEHFKPKHAATDMFCVFYGARRRRLHAAMLSLLLACACAGQAGRDSCCCCCRCRRCRYPCCRRCRWCRRCPAVVNAAAAMCCREACALTLPLRWRLLPRQAGSQAPPSASPP